MEALNQTLRRMNPTAQRIAIAEACGKQIVSTHNGEPVVGYSGGKCIICPDYLDDLNAMAEAEKRFFPPPSSLKSGADATQPYWRYQFELSKATHAGDADKGPLAIICATAAQRAEAFLKTLNLWQP